MMEELAGDAHISFEGDMRAPPLRSMSGVSQEETAVLDFPNRRKSSKRKTQFTWTAYAFTRWDEKAGLRGMRYAPKDRRAHGRKEKETGDEED